MKILSKLYNEYQSSNPEKFCEDFIYMREKDSPIKYIESICRILEIIPGITFNKIDYVTDETQTLYLSKGKACPIGKSRYNAIWMHFTIVHGDETEEIKVPVLLPKLVDDFFFEVNDSIYSAIYQIIDRAFYCTNDAVVLKATSMPLIMNFMTKSTIPLSVAGKTNFHSSVLKIFGRDINPLYFLMITGFRNGAKNIQEIMHTYGLTSEFVTLVEGNANDTNDIYGRQDVYHISNTKHLVINMEVIDEDHEMNYMVLSLAGLLRDNKRYKDETEYWLRKLGSFFSTNTNAFIIKAENIMSSFNRLMDETTRFSLNFVDEEDKVNSSAMVVWLMKNLHWLRHSDNLDLKNKRVRLFEYIVMPLQYRFNTATVRIINNGKQNTMKIKKQIFSNIQSDLLIKHLLSTNLHRYNNCTSGLDLLSAGLRWSARGPQSLADGTDNISEVYRDIHPSYLGTFELLNNSNGDPGLTGNFVPFSNNVLITQAIEDFNSDRGQ